MIIISKYVAILIGVPVILGIFSELIFSRVPYIKITLITIVVLLLAAFTPIFALIFGLPALALAFVEGLPAMWPLTFLPLFILDGYLFWLFVVIAAGLTISTVEYERPGWCTFVLAVVIGILEMYTNLHPITFAMHRPYDAAMFVGAYFVLGTVWMSLRWLVRIHWDVGEKFDAIKDGIIAGLVAEYQKSEQFLGREVWAAKSGSYRNSTFNSTVDAAQAEVMAPYVPIDGEHVKADLSLTEDGQKRVWEIAARQLGQRELPPQVSHHKAELYMWWICWPFNAIWTAIVTLGIKRVFIVVLNELGHLYQNLSNRRFKLD